MSGNRYNAFDSDGNKLTSHIRTGTRKGAFNANMALECREGKGGRIYWWKVPMAEFTNQEVQANQPVEPISVDVPSEHNEVLNFIHSSYNLKPVSYTHLTLPTKRIV